MKLSPSNFTLGLLTAAVATLTACGGGGGTAGGGTNPNLVTGVAATGLAIPDGSVTLRCTAGATNPVTTATDGSFSIDVSGLTLPCVARVEYTDATGKHKLHSLVTVTGNVNITPVTDMLVANLSNGVAADVFDKLDASKLKSYTKDRVSTSTTSVKTYLRDTLHVDTSKLPDDVIGTHFVATTKSRKGDDFDGVLDDLKAKLESKGKKLEEAEDESHHGHSEGGTGTTNTSAFATSTGAKADAAAGQSLYTASCSGCHGAGMPASVNYQRTLSAIAGNKGGMGYLSATITTAAADNIATYLAFGATPVALATQTITFTQLASQTMGVTTAPLAATSTSLLAVTLASSTPSVCTVTNTALTLMAAGTCTLTASQAGNASFAAATVISNRFTVLASSTPVLTPQTITFTAPASQTMGATPTLVATSTSNLVVTFASTTPAVCTVIGSTLTLVSPGTCALTASQAGNSSFAAAANASNSFQVTPVLMTGVAATGQTLYQGLCSGCHGLTPAVNLSRNILNAANAPSVISNAITKNIGNMGYLANPGYTPQQLADMAAYLATPGL